MILEQFYQISQKHPHDVTRKWKILHIALFALIAIFSFIASFSFGFASSIFLYNCILGSNLAFSDTDDIPIEPFNITIQAIDLTFTVWGRQSGCDFVQFTPLVSLLASVVWGAFFIILGRGGAGYPNDKLESPWKIVYPCIIFTTFMSCTLLASTTQLSVGLHKFCNNLNKELEFFNVTDGCTEYIDYFTYQFYEDKQSFFLASKATEIANYVAVVVWFVQLVLLIFRVCSITDYTIHIVRIIEEDKVIQYDSSYELESEIALH